MFPLPPEIWAIIVDKLAPPDCRLALPPSHEITKTLVSLSVTSKHLSYLAQPLLFKHCVYIDSLQRLECLDWGLSHALWRTYFLHGLPKHKFAVVKMFLAPFPDQDIRDKRKVANAIVILLAQIEGSLRRLVVDIPFRSCFPEDDMYGVRPLLRSAFLRLINLEEFVSVKDELYLDLGRAEDDPEQSETQVWSYWTNLRSLALYNTDLEDEDFLGGVVELPNIHTLVLIRCDSIRHGLPKLLVRLRRPLQIYLVNTAGGHDHDTDMVVAAPETLLHKEQFAVLVYRVDVPTMSDNSDIGHCQAWLRDKASDGVLWKFEDSTLLFGAMLLQSPQGS
ncbi:hypothetical protein K461DRAFT_270830 [Myriangium duriaei CBS 260.36]|uniref:F-box domain-containing protein n=1 Tax=Myriangium duriaei CBS 260.36 TaxID=1168546 RepID=A0A9P4MDT2_9PEZI|nr:hypothetical protein K461DRAFT_270830 [Myriangium duriaei CBS 260.36]